jgi:hypothetical protein
MFTRKPRPRPEKFAVTCTKRLLQQNRHVAATRKTAIVPFLRLSLSDGTSYGSPARGPISGAHLNPAVSIAFALRRELTASMLAVYIVAQVLGAILGVWAAHLMLELPLWQFSATTRSGSGQWLAEAIATFGLLLTIFGCVAHTPGGCLRRGPLHHGCLLVHRFNVFRQSGRNDRALVI